jgi:hypothetical protein
MRRTSGIALLLVIGCAAHNTGDVKVASADVPYSMAGQAKPKGVMRCYNESDTGSNFMKRICTYDEKNPQPGDWAIDDGMIKAQQRAAQHVEPGMRSQ